MEGLLLRKKGGMDLWWQLAVSALVSKGKGATWIKEEMMGPEIKRYALFFMSI